MIPISHCASARIYRAQAQQNNRLEYGMKKMPFFSLRFDSLSGLVRIKCRSEKKELSRLSRGGILFSLVIISLGINGCATTMGVQKTDPRQVYDEITISAISQDNYSKSSHDVLIRYNLVKSFKDDPREVLLLLHRKAEQGGQRDILFALAELSYLAGMRSRESQKQQSHSYFFASTLYAYFYLLDDTSPPNPFDRRFRTACDLYNSALAQALANADGNLRITSAKVHLPVGKFGFTLDTAKFPHDINNFEKFVSADQFKVRGFSLRNRDAGMGAPVIGVEKKSEGAPMYRTFPGTLFLRVNCNLDDVADDTCTGTLGLYSTYDHVKIVVDNKKVPLERDLTTQLAYTIDQPYIQGLGVNEFLYGTGYIKTGIYPMQPFEANKIPVVFVHGTFSSPVAWAEMVNSLRSDPVIANKYQFWNFYYDSGKRIGLSGRELADALTNLVNQVDPQGTNSLLRQMVVIGHSQGGLLTKMIATDSGDAFVRGATGKSLAELHISKKDKSLLEKEAVFKALPFVNRVVFISTPHRGSYLSKNLVRTLVLKLVRFPQTVLQSTANMMTALADAGVAGAMAQPFINMTSLDVMSPDSPILKIMAELPLSEGITGHSIISIDGNDTPPEGDDGVVKYASAHVDYVESEFIVRSPHSCQSHPLTIEEVRRILLKHLH
jgi:pimeloyl-ACP methyl ester carboxylesterase